MHSFPYSHAHVAFLSLNFAEGQVPSVSDLLNKLFQYCQVGYFSPLSLNQNYLGGRMNLCRKLSAFLYLTQEKGWDFCISHTIKILELICYLKYFISIVLQQYILIVTGPFWLYQSSIIYYKTTTIEIGIYCSVICHNKCSWYFLFYQNSEVISRQNLNYLFQLFLAGTIIETGSFQENILVLTKPQFLEYMLLSQDVFGVFHCISKISHGLKLWLKNNEVKSIGIFSFSYGETAGTKAGNINTSMRFCSMGCEPLGNSPKV